MILLKENINNVDEYNYLFDEVGWGSYGVEVAALAGVKKDVTKRAKEILKELEIRDGGTGVNVSGAGAKAAPDMFSDQLSLAGFEENEIVAEIRSLALDNMSPMEALTKLYEIKAKAENI